MISAIVLTKNEENNIIDCLEGLRWCDETIVIDDNSTDRTEEIAKNFGVKVIKHSLNEDFGEQRNFALTQANGDWIIFIDADERISLKLAKEIQKEIGSSKAADGYFFKRIDNFMGLWLKHGEIGNIKILRLARKGWGKWERSVDETWEINGIKKTFKNPLLHFSHPTINEFIQSINERSSLNAKQLYKEGKKLNLFEWSKPKIKFIQNYFFKLGFLDGTRGFVFAVLMSLHSFLVRGKLFLIWKKEGGWK